ncbi:glycerophosphodiester phosphodiesterase [Craterilacuibacter sp. RT1T]|uniref:glycerophosphodiester phosphodiesterase n=1 Tax=Craterilacuibacter sp. RT1T TaxID=2942211 RepID=UPI0020BF70AD|nr:glycerophosphodiester phosphodiesterase [Craterilacuibacter sp. RT1T]MCL6264143.1 glycerophosphodiester phosphodiesterase [Craterilacuibacter sp. RT1T]
MMKTPALLSSLLASCLILPAYAAQTPAYPTLSGKAPLIIAHRGASGYLPEHTLEAYARAVELGADYIEPDLVSTKDGVLIARHEPNLKDSTDVASRPEFADRKKKLLVDGVEEEGWFAPDFTLAEIKTLRAVQQRADRPQEFNGQFPIPTFEEILVLREKLSKQAGREVGIYPETKHPSWHAAQQLALEPALLAGLKKHGLNRKNAPVFIQSFESANLKALRKQTPVKLVFLLDGNDVTVDGKMQAGRPYDFVLSGDSRTFVDLTKPAALKEIRRFADGIGPWKPYIMASEGMADKKTGQAADVNGDKVVDMQDRTLLEPGTLVRDAHKAGLFVHAYTFRNEPKYLAANFMNDPLEEYKAYYALGVDGVFSDFADTALKARSLK